MWADDHFLLEALGTVAGVPLGRCYYLSTAVVRIAVEEWVERLRRDPEIGAEVERVLSDKEYQRELYRQARAANPHARRSNEQRAAHEVMRREETEKLRAKAEAAKAEQETAALDQAITEGKAMRLETARERKLSGRRKPQ